MIKCKNCGSENTGYYVICEECASEFKPSDEEIRQLISEAEEARDNSDYEMCVRIYKFLAELGVREGERELALMLEEGRLLPRNIEMAMRYFCSAAKKGDEKAAYKYANLASATSTDAADFWLAYSAICGYHDAYADAAKMYSRHSDEITASYYIRLCAEAGEVDAIYEMARRHLYGIGVEQNEGIAKCYIDRIEKIPLFAAKLYRRLRGVKAPIQPTKLVFEKREKILRSLIAEAKKQKFRAVLTRLAEIYSKIDTPDANVDIANLYIEGIEFPKDVERGIALLEEAMNSGSAVGACYLGDLFANGEQVERDVERALGYYKKAVRLGGDGVYETLGDVYYDGRLTEPMPVLALALYTKGMNEGSKSCEKKAKQIKSEREKNYIEACKIEKASPEEAFPLLVKSVNAGYNLAHAKIAYYYECGIGTKVNGKAAFEHYKTAYELGDVRATEGLGRCYARGIGVAFNFNTASKYLSEAKSAGSAGADRELYRIYENKKRHMTRSLYSTAMRLFYNKKFELALDMLKTCMSFGLPEAVYSIGCLYEFGIILPADRQTARKYYDKAAELGYSGKGAHKQKILKMSK